MPKRALNEDDPLDDFEHPAITLDDVTKGVHVAGTGSAVIVMTEMPGIIPHVARFSRWVREAGFTVYMPSLFGRDGTVPAAARARRPDRAGLSLRGGCQRVLTCTTVRHDDRRRSDRATGESFT